MKSNPASRASRIELWIALALTALLIVLHLLLLSNRGPLWRDEISSLALAHAPSWQKFWSGLALDPLPALFPVLLRGWATLVGDSDFPLRILGCLIGLACVAAFWLNARLVDRQTPLLSLGLLGLSPTLLIWGDSLRGYGLGVFWIVISFALFWRLIRRPSGWVFAATTAAATLSVQSLYINSLLIFSCASAAAIVAATRRQWSRSILSLGAGALAAFSLLPYLPLFRATAEWAALGRVDFSLANSFHILGDALLGPRNFLLWEWLVLIAAAIVLAGFSAFRENREPTEPASAARVYALIAASGGLLCTMTFFRVVGWGTNVWYYLPMLAVAAVALDTILDGRTVIAQMSALRSGVTLVILALTLSLSLRATQIRATNIDRSADLIARQAVEGDLVVIWPGSDATTFQRYLRRPLHWIAVPMMPHFPIEPGDDLLVPFRDPNSLEPVREQIRETLRGGHRVWLESSWPLVLPDGPVRRVIPWSKSSQGSLGYFLRGWGFILADDLRRHAEHPQLAEAIDDQPVSGYEKSAVSIFAGWKD